MGYWASGSGSAMLKDDVDRKTLISELSKEDKWGCSFMNLYNVVVGNHTIFFEENDDHWHEEDLMEFFNIIKPYITQCEATYVGEDYYHWKYRFNKESDKFESVDGEVYYGGLISDENKLEFIGEIIDGIEDFLTAKGISFPETKQEMLDAGMTEEDVEENDVVLFGENYDAISSVIEDVCKAWNVFEK